jgi:hypothetical protein
MFWLTLAWTENNGAAVEQDFGFVDPQRLVRYLISQAFVGPYWSRTRIVGITRRGLGGVLLGHGPVDMAVR